MFSVSTELLSALVLALFKSLISLFSERNLLVIPEVQEQRFPLFISLLKSLLANVELPGHLVTFCCCFLLKTVTSGWLYSDALNHTTRMEYGIIYIHLLLVMPSSSWSVAFNRYFLFLLNSVSSEPARRNFFPLWHYVKFYASWIFLLFLVNAVVMNMLLHNGCVVIIRFVETMKVRWQRQ